MSTKIYNGFRLLAGVDAFTFIKQVRAVMDPLRDQLEANNLIHSAVEMIDSADVKGEARPKEPIRIAYKDYRRLQIDLRRDGDTLDCRYDPFSFDMCIGRDPGTERLHVILFAEAREFHAAFLAMPEVEEFGYWNNSDHPNGVTDVQWAERGAAWERVIPGFTPPSECMLSFQLRGPYHSGLYETFRHHDEPGSIFRSAKMPSKSERAGRIASVAIVGEAVRRGIDVMDALDSLHRNRTDFKRVVTAYSKWLKPLKFDHLDLLCSQDNLRVPGNKKKRLAAEATMSVFVDKAFPTVKDRDTARNLK